MLLFASIVSYCQIMDCELIKQIFWSFHWHLLIAVAILNPKNLPPWMVSRIKIRFQKIWPKKHKWFWNRFRVWCNQTGPKCCRCCACCEIHAVTSQWARWRLESPASRSLSQPLVQAQIKENTPKLRVNGLCEGNSPVTGGFPSQRSSDAENVSICWHHGVNREVCFMYWYYSVLLLRLYCPGARPTNDISIEFEIRSKFGVL